VAHGLIELLSASLGGAPPLPEPVPTGSAGHQFVAVKTI